MNSDELIYTENWVSPYYPNLLTKLGINSGAFYHLAITSSSIKLELMPIKGPFTLFNYVIALLKHKSTSKDYLDTKQLTSSIIISNSSIHRLQYHKKTLIIFFANNHTQAELRIYCPEKNKAYEALKQII